MPETPLEPSVNFGALTPTIYCPMVGSMVTVCYSCSSDGATPIACTSSQICEVAIEDQAHRKAMGCPAPDPFPC